MRWPWWQPLRREPRATPERPLVIPLEVLATLWVDRAEPAADPARAAGPAPGQATGESGSPADGQPAQLPRPRGAPAAPSLVETVLRPYQALLAPVWEPLVAICRFLDEHGHGPSVVIAGAERDEESTDLYSIRDTLAKVSLRDHTARVARHAVALLQQQYRDPEPLLGKVLLAALGHDLGKAAVLRQSGLYSLHDHPAISVAKLRELVPSPPFWFEDALTMILEHHRVSKQPLSILLQQADRRAREEEVAAVTQTMAVRPWEDWCRADRLLALLADRVNVLQRGAQWEAVTFDGVVYCRPEALYEAAKRLAQQERVIDLTLLAGAAREEACRKVVRTLKAAGALAVDIGEGFHGLWYEIRSTQTRAAKRAYLVPLTLEAFGRKASDFERLKEGPLQTITAIKPVRRGGAASTPPELADADALGVV